MEILENNRQQRQSEGLIEKSILVVEDDEFQRQVLRIQLSADNIDVLEAANGIEALDKVDRYGHCISLILCDLDMPEMDGMEFVRNLGTRDARPEVVLLSSSDNSMLSSVDTMCRAYGVTTRGTYQKPLSRDKIAQLLADLREPPTRNEPVSASSQAPKSFPEAEILTALEQGEILPYFQAKLDLATNSLIGAEALARWQHPSLGLLSPFSFIPVLEQGSGIDALTYTLLQQAVAQQRQWMSQGYALKTSINLSPISLKDSSFADKLTDIVADAGVSPKSIVFEITETAAMQDLAPALENLARLRLRGFGLSIDDFGTGFSSMEQLGRIAFTELKIDRTFVSTMLDRKESRAIVEFSIDMARKLGINSVAEGVETADELNLLKNLGCDQVQGYLIGKPECAESFSERLAGGDQCTAA